MHYFQEAQTTTKIQPELTNQQMNRGEALSVNAGGLQIRKRLVKQRFLHPSPSLLFFFLSAPRTAALPTAERSNYSEINRPPLTHLWKIFHRKPWSGGALICGGALYGLWYAILNEELCQKFRLVTPTDCLCPPPPPAVVSEWLKSDSTTQRSLRALPSRNAGVANHSRFP